MISWIEAGLKRSSRLSIGIRNGTHRYICPQVGKMAFRYRQGQPKTPPCPDFGFLEFPSTVASDMEAAKKVGADQDSRRRLAV